MSPEAGTGQPHRPLLRLRGRNLDADLMLVGPSYEVVVLDDRLSHPTDPANRVLLDHRGQRIRLLREEGVRSDRERLGNRQWELATWRPGFGRPPRRPRPELYFERPRGLAGGSPWPTS